MEDRYDYDSLNRLTGVSEYQKGPTLTGTQQYDYDRWGNRTFAMPCSLSFAARMRFPKKINATKK
jgi:hypothetical protein